jgi:hypothetical protein
MRQLMKIETSDFGGNKIVNLEEIFEKIALFLYEETGCFISSEEFVDLIYKWDKSVILCKEALDVDFSKQKKQLNALIKKEESCLEKLKKKDSESKKLSPFYSDRYDSFGYLVRKTKIDQYKSVVKFLEFSKQNIFNADLVKQRALFEIFEFLEMRGLTPVGERKGPGKKDSFWEAVGRITGIYDRESVRYYYNLYAEIRNSKGFVFKENSIIEWILGSQPFSVCAT